MKNVNVYHVNSLVGIKLMNYNDGDIFITKRSIAILANNKLHTIETEKPDLKDYVKKDEVKKMIKKVVENND